MKVNEVTCSSVLSDTELYGLDYSVNPYVGCAHGCTYCYAVFMKRFTGHGEEWGRFVDVKTNAPKVLRKEVQNKKVGSVLLSSVTDAYQPLEKRFEITRKVLRTLEKEGFHVSILTKNDLVLRDLDILKRFDHGRLSVGFTVNFLDEKDRKLWEPGTSDIGSRIEALEKLRKEGIPTYVHVGPWLEGITDLKKIVRAVEENVYEIQVENLNTRRDRKIVETVEKGYPELTEVYRRTVKNKKDHNRKLQSNVESIRKETDVPIRLYLD